MPELEVNFTILSHGYEPDAGPNSTGWKVALHIPPVRVSVSVRLPALS
jgi:hypothetical protein